jgi:plastocyanin
MPDGEGLMKIPKTRSRRRWLAMAVMIVISVTISAEEQAADHRHFEITVIDRTVQLDPNVIRVTMGDRVTLSWTSDEAGSLHLHGYDIEFEVGPGRTETMTFLASATGRFPITSHGFGGEEGHGHKALLYLEVYPD